VLKTVSKVLRAIWLQLCEEAQKMTLICFYLHFANIKMVIQLTYTLIPIGHVKKTDNEIHLVIKSEYWDATVHLELFSHIIVLWWIDRMDTPVIRHTLLANPPKNKGPTASGVFACRSPARPNPIGHTVVKIESIDAADSRILIDHMDAEDGTPLLDIKPYLPSSDRVENAIVAPWFENLHPRYS